jgi:hypothetical protein
MVRRWAVFRVSGDLFAQVGSAPSQGLAATEALQLAAATRVPHHIAEQIISRETVLAQQARSIVMRRFADRLPEGA